MDIAEAKKNFERVEDLHSRGEASQEEWLVAFNLLAEARAALRAEITEAD